MAARNLSTEEIARAAYQAGFRGQALVTIVAIAFPESGGNANARNPNRSTGDNSYGLTQINMIDKLGPQRRKQFGISSNEQLKDPVTNMKAAFIVSGGGKNFGPWTTYKKGLHNAHVAKAQAAVQKLGHDIGNPLVYKGESPGWRNPVYEGPLPDDDDYDPGARGPILPTEEEVRDLFQQLLGFDPNDSELERYTGKSTKQAKELMLQTEDGLEMSILRGLEALRAEIR